MEIRDTPVGNLMVSFPDGDGYGKWEIFYKELTVIYAFENYECDRQIGGCLVTDYKGNVLCFKPWCEWS